MSGDAGFGGRVQDAEEVVGFAEGVLGVAEGEHGDERGGFGWSERADPFVAVEESPEVIEVNGDAVASGGIVHQDEPFDNVAFDGVCEIVDGVGAVGETEIDDGCGAGVREWCRSRRGWRRGGRCGSRAMGVRGAGV